jgi:NAD(P)H-dependent FMN reductase
MITLVSGTNRLNSRTREVTNIYQSILVSKGIETQIVDLALVLPSDIIGNGLYANAGKNEDFNMVRELMWEAQKFVFIVPEYNGSFPGVLEVFIDALKFPGTFIDKKAGLIGLGSGLQGAVIGMSHLTDIFAYLQMSTLGFKPKLAQIDKHLVNGELTNELYASMMHQHADKMIAF